MANNVKFVYVSRKANLPAPEARDASAVYFVEDAQQLYVGDKLIASHMDPEDLLPYLENFKVKDIEILGEGSIISDVDFDEETGKITVTKSNLDVEPVTQGDDIIEDPVDVEPGDSAEIVTNVTIEDNVLTVSKTSFSFPNQISDIQITTDPETGKLILKTISSDGEETVTELSDLATSDQGALAETAMQSDGGSATNAEVSLAHDPEDPMDAATKQYVDNAVDGLTKIMRYLGVSTKKLTDGGREKPKIKGEELELDSLNAGDVVLYSPENDGKYKEFIWALDDADVGYWSEIGDTEVEITIPDGYIIEHIPDGSIEESKLSPEVQEKLSNVDMDPITPPEVDNIVTTN